MSLRLTSSRVTEFDGQDAVCKYARQRGRTADMPSRGCNCKAHLTISSFTRPDILRWIYDKNQFQDFRRRQTMGRTLGATNRTPREMKKDGAHEIARGKDKARSDALKQQNAALKKQNAALKKQRATPK